MFNRSIPIVKNRGVHLDLKGIPPTFRRLMEIIDLYSFLRIDFLLFEMEDMFPWESYPILRSKNAYSKIQMKQFYEYCKKKNIQIIPLVQSYGHLENILTKKEFAKFRERRNDPSDVCPLKGGARNIILAMIKDVLEIFPDVTHFHLGGDEVMSFFNYLGFGRCPACPKCQKYMEKHGKAQLYLIQLNPLVDYLNKQGIRPILWDDMMREWTFKELKNLKKRADLMPWAYGRNPFNRSLIKAFDNFEKAGISLWGAGAYRCGGEGIIPDLAARAENIKNWSIKARTFHLHGLVATGWARSDILTVPYGPLENALESLCLSAKIMWDGEYDLEDDLRDIRLSCQKWLIDELRQLNEEFQRLLSWTAWVIELIENDRGLRESGPSNIFRLKNCAHAEEKFNSNLNSIKKRLVKTFKKYTFSSDIEDWLTANQKIISGRFISLQQAIQNYLLKRNQ